MTPAVTSDTMLDLQDEELDTSQIDTSKVDDSKVDEGRHSTAGVMLQDEELDTSKVDRLVRAASLKKRTAQRLLEASGGDEEEALFRAKVALASHRLQGGALEENSSNVHASNQNGSNENNGSNANFANENGSSDDKVARVVAALNVSMSFKTAQKLLERAGGDEEAAIALANKAFASHSAHRAESSTSAPGVGASSSRQNSEYALLVAGCAPPRAGAAANKAANEAVERPRDQPRDQPRDARESRDLRQSRDSLKEVDSVCDPCNTFSAVNFDGIFGSSQQKSGETGAFSLVADLGYFNAPGSNGPAKSGSRAGHDV